MPCEPQITIVILLPFGGVTGVVGPGHVTGAENFSTVAATVGATPLPAGLDEPPSLSLDPQAATPAPSMIAAVRDAPALPAAAHLSYSAP